MPNYDEPITGYAYTKEKKYSYIDPETGKIVYSETPPAGFVHTPRPHEAEGYAPPTEIPEQKLPTGYREHWAVSGGLFGEERQEKFLGYVRPEVDTGIDTVPKQDYELGRLTILRQYTDDMKIARAYKNADLFMYESLARDAETRKVLGLAELQANLDKSKGAFRQIDDNLNLSPEEQFKIKTSYYQKNPVFQMPTSERTKRPEIRKKETSISELQSILESPYIVLTEEQRTEIQRQIIARMQGIIPAGGEITPTIAPITTSPTVPAEKQEFKKPPKGEWWEETKFRLKGGTLEELKERRQAAIKPSAQMQSAPDVKLDPYWRTIPDDMKSLVWRAFREGDSPEQILNELRNRGIIK